MGSVEILEAYEKVLFELSMLRKVKLAFGKAFERRASTMISLADLEEKFCATNFESLDLVWFWDATL